MPENLSTLESVLKRDRLIVLAGLIGVSVLAWAYLVLMAMGMEQMPADTEQAIATTQIAPWTFSVFVLMFLMWVIMMVAMMVPSATPMVLIFAAYNRKLREDGRPYVPAAAFLSGYLLVWCGFSLVATLLQWALDQAALLSPMMVSTSPLLGGALLMSAGLFQLTPAKDRCLSHCRSPLEFFKTGWRTGVGGALRMGIEHGAFCLGCCWILMGLLFFGGVMNILWIAAITFFVLVEKVLPFGPILGRVSGPCLIIAGLAIIVLS